MWCSGRASEPVLHALYAGDEVAIRIDTLEIEEGSFPRRALALVLEGAALHRAELLADWDRAARHEPLAPIAPLD